MANIAIISCYSGIVERGVETFAYEIGKRLTTGHKVTLISAGNIGPQKFKVIQIKTHVDLPKSQEGFLGKFYFDRQSLRVLIFTLKTLPRLYKNKFDLVIPLNGGWQIVLLRIFSKLLCIKILISGHAGIGSDDAFNIFFRPDVFVALTSAQAQWAQKLAGEVKTVVIPNGVDLARFHPKIKPKSVPLEKPIVICTSALVLYKRVDLTIRAVAKAKMSLLVLGDGQLHGSIDTLGKRILGKRYLRLIVPYEEIPSYYRAGRVFTLASQTEAFGISYVEAMACNLPVVTTNDSSRAEIIGDAGILTNPENIEKYAKDLESAASTNFRNIPYSQALKFSWNKVAIKYSNLIKDLLRS